MQPYEKHLNGKKERRKKEMNKVFKRLLSVMLALVMVVGMIPVSAIPVKAATRTVYFKAPDSWTTAGAHMWNSNGSDTTTTPQAMTKVEGTTSTFKIDITNDNLNMIIFTQGAGNWSGHTANLNIPTDLTTDNMYTYESSSWGLYGSSTTTTKTIYLDTTNYMPTSTTIGWTEAYIYMWTNGVDGSGTTVKMTEISDGVFSYAVPTNYDRVIFKPNQSNWTLKTNDQTIPSDKDLFTCTSFGSVTSGVWGTYGTKVDNNFPSNVTGKVTFFDLYTDTEIKGSTEYYGLENWTYRVYNGASYTDTSASSGRSFTAIGRAFSNKVNEKISAYWASKNSSVSPLYFGNFQPFYKVEPADGGDANSVYCVDPWWISSNDYKYDHDNNNQTNDIFWRAGYMADVESVTNFSWFLNRSVDVNNGGSSAMYGAVVQGIAGSELVNGNIVAKGTQVVLPQFNSEFYNNTYGNIGTVGRVYPTMDFPFAIREIDGAYYYQFDSGVNGSSNRDTVRMNSTGTALTYYNDNDNVVYGITADGNKSPGFFPFNKPSDSNVDSYNDNGTTKYYYNDDGNKLNYGFGMKLEIEFTMDSDGKVKDKNGNRIPAVFEFSGDDDVWIYVDNKLALDLGGSHGVAQGKLDFSNKKAVVQYVKTVNGKSDAAEAVAVENTWGTKDYINSLAATGPGVSSNASLSTTSGNNITSFEIDKFDPNKIHTLTIFYEERGMFESNFKATFNLEQPTVLKTTNTVDVSGVNSALQTATETVAADAAFAFEINDANSADVTGKKYATETGASADFNGTMNLKDGQSATFTKQFDRAAVLELIQTADSRFNTLWTMSELSDTGAGTQIANSYQTDRTDYITSDGRVSGKETTAFKLENKDNGADASAPAKVQVDYIQEPKTGGIAIMKMLDEDLEATDVFDFTLYLSDIFGVESAATTYDVSYDVYNFDGESSTIVRKGVTATNGVISLKAGQFAIVNGIPVGTNYKIVENAKVGYTVTGLDVSTNLNNDTDVMGDVATGTVTGTVVEDTESNVDMFVYTNGVVTTKDSFLVEIGKENTLNVIPTAANDGTLSGDLADINSRWTASTATKGFVFIVDGEPYVDENGKPITTLDVKLETDPGDGAEAAKVTYTVTTTENGDPVIKVTPSADAVAKTSTNTITIKYQLVELDENGAVKYNEIPDTEDPTKTIEELAAITSVIAATNYLYKANDDVYVLDYGLDVNLAEKSGDGLFENDSLANPSLTGTTSTYWNTAKGEIESTASADTTAVQNTAQVSDTYGKIIPTGDDSTGFVIDAETTDGTVHNPKITYSLDKFLNAKDSFNYGVMVQKGDANVDAGQTSNRFRLNVTSNISIFPANVVYYEDNFNSDVTNTTDSTVKIIYSGDSDDIATAGTSLTLMQSNGQTEQYGHDDAYTDDDTKTSTGDSAGSSTMMTADGYKTKAVFTFTGTGFDIIARTNNTTAGIFCIIDKVNDDGTLADTPVKTVGVDTYYANGDLYQIPVIHEDVEYGTYQVTLGIKAASNGNEVVYLDGIRIYNPLGTLTDEEKEAYIDNEEGATFVKVSDLILGNGEITESGIINEDGSTTIEGQSIEGSSAAILTAGFEKPLEAIGYTKVENTEGNGLVSSYSVLTYLNAGPNNEVYLDENGIFAFIAEGTPSAQNTIQIEAKLLSTDNNVVDGSLELKICAVDEDGYLTTVELDNPLEVTSSTAMYYEIPVDKCIKLSDGKYLVAIQGDFDRSKNLCISLSNLKYNGYTISNPLDDETAVGSYIYTYSDSDSKFKEILGGSGSAVGTLSLVRNTWYEKTYSIVLNEDVFAEGTTPKFTMYYVKASGAKTPITVTAVEISPTVYSLTFKSPNAVGEFPVEIHYVDSNGDDSTQYFSTTMSVRRK